MVKKQSISDLVSEVLEEQPHLRNDHWRLYWEVASRYQDIPDAVRDFVLNNDLPNYEYIRRVSRPSGRAGVTITIP